MSVREAVSDSVRRAVDRVRMPSMDAGILIEHVSVGEGPPLRVLSRRGLRAPYDENPQTQEPKLPLEPTRRSLNS